MTNFDTILDDSTEVAKVIRHFMTIEWDKDSAQLEVVETKYDAHNSSFRFEDKEGAQSIAGELNISMDKLMNECVDIIYKNGR